MLWFQSSKKIETGKKFLKIQNNIWLCHDKNRQPEGGKSTKKKPKSICQCYTHVSHPLSLTAVYTLTTSCHSTHSYLFSPLPSVSLSYTHLYSLYSRGHLFWLCWALEIEDCCNQKTGRASITAATNQTARSTGSQWEKLHTEMIPTSLCVCMCFFLPILVRTGFRSGKVF